MFQQIPVRVFELVQRVLDWKLQTSSIHAGTRSEQQRALPCPVFGPVLARALARLALIYVCWS